MKEISSTTLARNVKKILDEVEFAHEEVTVIRNTRAIARILPGQHHKTALEAMTDIYKTLSDKAGKTWYTESRKGHKQTLKQLKNPWDI